MIEIEIRRPFTVPEAAVIADVSGPTMYRAIYRGAIKVTKGFGRLMIPAEELDRFLNRSVVVHRPKTKNRGRKRRVLAPCDAPNAPLEKQTELTRSKNP